MSHCLQLELLVLVIPSPIMLERLDWETISIALAHPHFEKLKEIRFELEPMPSETALSTRKRIAESETLLRAYLERWTSTRGAGIISVSETQPELALSSPRYIQ